MLLHAHTNKIARILNIICHGFLMGHKPHSLSAQKVDPDVSQLLQPAVYQYPHIQELAVGEADQLLLPS